MPYEIVPNERNGKLSRHLFATEEKGAEIMTIVINNGTTGKPYGAHGIRTISSRPVLIRRNIPIRQTQKTHSLTH